MDAIRTQVTTKGDENHGGGSGASPGRARARHGVRSPSKPSLRVAVVDDHEMFGEAMKMILELELGATVVGVAASASKGLDLVRRTQPDIVLVDYRLPDFDGIELGRQILAASPSTKVVMLTGSRDASTADAALAAGLHGFVTKGGTFSQVIHAVAEVRSGGVTRRPAVRTVRRRPASDPGMNLLADHLTARERDVLALLVEGASSKEMARRLSLRPNTVRTHVQNVLTKLQVHSRVEAASQAMRHGMVSLNDRDANSSRSRLPES